MNIANFVDGLSCLFDIVRVVNSTRKKVVYQNGDGSTIIHGQDCYEFWERGKVCDNCISSQAVREKRTFTKVEYKGDGVYMVMAAPIKFGDELYVLELLKDITETGIVTGLSGLSSKETNDIIIKLNEKAIRDDLTGVYNRRYINQRLPIDIDYAMKHKEKLAVAMVDIDFFKGINDSYGHTAGDLVLKELSSTIISIIRSNYDWVARFGGDEFFIVLKDFDEELAMEVMGKIKNAVENMVIRFDNHRLNITISIGFCVVDPGTKNFDEIIYEIDTNLKKAKKGSKNRIVAS
ncbi:GGDEF domain-containing protein [Tissierella sp.]|uniref:GGDEF domain-containing protein n=1 Tax=Tissierella sp. TaxID=41274 RepID=UPI0028A6EC4B|nr:GGDEF domain-containing protein [Tissierella sp.]